MEHISHLHQLETLNLQNNWLTTQGKHERNPAGQAAASRNTPAAVFQSWMDPVMPRGLARIIPDFSLILCGGLHWCEHIYLLASKTNKLPENSAQTLYVFRPVLIQSSSLNREHKTKWSCRGIALILHPLSPAGLLDKENHFEYIS